MSAHMVHAGRVREGCRRGWQRVARRLRLFLLRSGTLRGMVRWMRRTTTRLRHPCARLGVVRLLLLVRAAWLHRGRCLRGIVRHGDGLSLGGWRLFIRFLYRAYTTKHYLTAECLQLYVYSEANGTAWRSGLPDKAET